MSATELTVPVAVLLLLCHIYLTDAVPISNHHCPVPTTSSELGSIKVLDLHEIQGHKVRLQFFYPSEVSRKLLASVESTTWSPLPKNETSASTPGSMGMRELVSEEGFSSERDNETLGQDIYCQWTFKAGNESQFLSITFEKLSAPYSDNCADAFVALQKENGYESRWCGNRRQANARPMSLLARSSAVVTVYRSGRAPIQPVTGFKVSVKELDFGSLQGAESSLRVLLG